MELPNDIDIGTETWVESQPQEMHGYNWRCQLCPEEQRRVYSFDAVERESARHLRTAHGKRADWDDIR